MRTQQFLKVLYRLGQGHSAEREALRDRIRLEEDCPCKPGLLSPLCPHKLVVFVSFFLPFTLAYIHCS